MRNICGTKHCVTLESLTATNKEKNCVSRTSIENQHQIFRSYGNL